MTPDDHLEELRDSHPLCVSRALEQLRRWPLDEERLVLLRALCHTYAEAGVLERADGTPSLGKPAPALHERCPDCSQCWRGSKTPPESEDARSVSLPYVGDEYMGSRIVVVALNTNQSGGLIVLWKIISEAVSDEWAGVHRRQGNFAREMARPVQMLLRHASQDADTLAAIKNMAFLQAVKCGISDGHRGSPGTQMLRRCPPRFLMREMDELQPRIVLTLGWDAAEPIRQALGVSDWKWEKTKQLEHGTFEHAAGSARLISLSHPRGRTWSKSLGELDRALTRPDFLESSAHPAS